MNIMNLYSAFTMDIVNYFIRRLNIGSFEFKMVLFREAILATSTLCLYSFWVFTIIAPTPTPSLVVR